jgi:peptidyl-prolyl cis-trans isomerase C
MLKLAKLAMLAMAGALMATPAFSQDKPAATGTAASGAVASGTAAMVNGAAIPQSLVDMRVKVAASQGQPDTPDFRKKVLDDLITLKILSQEAHNKGLDKQPDTVQQIEQQTELDRQNILAMAYVQDYTKNHPISEDTLKQEYESLKVKLGNTEYKVAHILVSSEDEAKAIEAQLKKKGKFENIAKEKSKDPGSSEHGGDLGWNVPSNFVPPFADAMTHLKKGQISAPVQSQFGWHIIKLEDTRSLNVPPFEQVKPNLMQRLQQQSVQKVIADLRKDAKIE